MSTIATLNLPSSTSGIWRSAPPCGAGAAQADPPPLAPAEAAGAALLHAPKASAPIASRESQPDCFVAMVLLLDTPAARDGLGRARQRLRGRGGGDSALGRNRPGFPAPSEVRVEA